MHILTWAHTSTFFKGHATAMAFKAISGLKQLPISMSMVLPGFSVLTVCREKYDGSNNSNLAQLFHICGFIHAVHVILSTYNNFLVNRFLAKPTIV